MSMTPNFRRGEFECRCGCRLSEPHPLLVAALQRLRDIIRMPITITSGSRCVAHNKAVGGAPGSYHLRRADYDGYTLAADIVVAGLPLVEVYKIVDIMEHFRMGGVGVYIDDTPRLHVDVRRSGPVRWAVVDGETADVETALADPRARRLHNLEV